MSIQDVTRVIQTIIRPSKLPVYVHCLDGADVTGAVICCLRRLQAWYKDSVDSEFLRYSRTGEMSGKIPLVGPLFLASISFFILGSMGSIPLPVPFF